MVRWLTPRWLLGHLIIGVIAAVCLRLGWWQWEHAVQGNTVSFGYALQWPLFAAFGVFFWARIVKDRTRPGDAVDTALEPLPPLAFPIGHAWSYQRGGSVEGQTGQPVTASAVKSGVDDPDAANYEHMLQWLNADPQRRLADYPGINRP